METTVSYLLQKHISSKQKESEIKYYALCLGNIQKILRLIIRKKTGLKGIVKFFWVDFNPIDINDVLDTHIYLMKKTCVKKCLELLNKCLLYY